MTADVWFTVFSTETKHTVLAILQKFTLHKINQLINMKINQKR